MTLEITNQVYPITANVGYGDLGSFQAASDAAAASAISAANSSSAAGAASGRLEVASFAELASVFGYSSAGGRRMVAAGDLIRVVGLSGTYQVLASGASGAHLDYTGSGGVKLNVLRVGGVFVLDHFGNPATPATWTAALNAANGDPVALHSDHTLTGTVSYSGPVRIYGNGHQVNMGTAGALDFTATITNLPNLASDIARHANTVTFDSAHGLVEGDVFCVWNPTSFSWSSHRDYYRDGDWMRVAEVVSSTQVRIYGHAPDAYAAASMTCHKITGQGVSVADMRIVPRASGAFFTVEYHQGVKLEGLVCPAGNPERNILVSRCYDVTIRDMRSTSLKAGGAQNAYPVVISNCKKVRATGSAQHSDRHVMGFGGGTSAGSVPTRDVVISGMLMTNLDTGIGAADAHGNVDDITFANCIIDASMNVGGRNVRAIGCKVRGRNWAADGLCVYADEVVGGLYQFTSCEFETTGNGASFGIIDFAPYSLNGSIMQQLREAWTLRLDGCTIRNLGSGSSTMRCVRVFVGNSADGAITQHPIDIVINNLDVDSPSMLTVLGIAGTNNYSANLRIAINDGLIAPSGSLVSFTNAANAAALMRLPRQVRTEAITYATSVASVTGTAQTFPWAYPKIPLASVGFQRTDNAGHNPGTTNLAQPHLFSQSTTTIRGQIKSSNGSNFSIAGDGRLVMEAWVRDF